MARKARKSKAKRKLRKGKKLRSTKTLTRISPRLTLRDFGGRSAF